MSFYTKLKFPSLLLVLTNGYEQHIATETYVGSEKSIEYHYRRGYDAPSGGVKPIHYSVWNPREYFLLIVKIVYALG